MESTANNHRSLTESKKGVVKGDLPSRWAVPPRDLQKTKARRGCKGRDATPPKVLQSVPQIGGHSLVTDLGQIL